jgi:hypothetical protein
VPEHDVVVAVLANDAGANTSDPAELVMRAELERRNA